MSRKYKVPFEIKLKYVQEYLNGKNIASDICKELNISLDSFYIWVGKYNTNGVDGLRPIIQNTKYPDEIKNIAVEYYLSGKGSLLETCRKYNISSDSVLRRWIKRYNNSHKQLKSHSAKENKIMLKEEKQLMMKKLR